MKQIQLIIIIYLAVSISSSLLGRVGNARLLPGLKNQSVWLFNQSTADMCLCTATQLYSLANIAALNSFIQNKTCQVILSPPVLSPRIVTDTKCNLTVLQPLTDTPCCSDISWVLERIKNTVRKFTTNVNQPTTLSISSNNKYVSTINYRTNTLVRLYRDNLTSAGTQSLPSGYVCASAIYRQGYIAFGCDTPAALVFFNETNLNVPVAQINMSLYVRSASFTRNNTLMFVPVQRSSYSLYVYNITWQPSIRTSLMTKFTSTTSTQQTWTTNAINDTVVLMTTWGISESVNIIRSPSSTSNLWNISTLPRTTVGSSEYLADVAIDSCGRIWITVNKYGIRIYDPSGTISLANWTLSTGLSNILLLDNYELILTDYDNNYIYQYKPNLKCTS